MTGKFNRIYKLKKKKNKTKNKTKQYKKQKDEKEEQEQKYNRTYSICNLPAPKSVVIKDLKFTIYKSRDLQITSTAIKIVSVNKEPQKQLSNQ